MNVSDTLPGYEYVPVVFFRKASQITALIYRDQDLRNIDLHRYDWKGNTQDILVAVLSEVLGPREWTPRRKPLPVLAPIVRKQRFILYVKQDGRESVWYPDLDLEFEGNLAVLPG